HRHREDTQNERHGPRWQDRREDGIGQLEVTEEQAVGTAMEGQSEGIEKRQGDEIADQLEHGAEAEGEDYGRGPVPPTMITDDQLYSLAIFLGSISMLLIVLYHFLEVNAQEEGAAAKDTSPANKTSAAATKSSHATTTTGAAAGGQGMRAEKGATARPVNS
ncbi:MAG: hypothetical protein L6R36_008989, partial [Xanthoria steineri]